MFIKTQQGENVNIRQKNQQIILKSLSRMAQWLRGRASDSRLKEPGFCSLYIAPVHSAV